MFTIQRKLLAARFEGTILVVQLIVCFALLAAIAAILSVIIN